MGDDSVIFCPDAVTSRQNVLRSDQRAAAEGFVLLFKAEAGDVRVIVDIGFRAAINAVLLVNDETVDANARTCAIFIYQRLYHLPW